MMVGPPCSTSVRQNKGEWVCTCETPAGTWLRASAWVTASMATQCRTHNKSMVASRRRSRVDPRTCKRNSLLAQDPKMTRINSVDRRPIPDESNSRRRQTAAAFLLARRLCTLRRDNGILRQTTLYQGGRSKNEGKHSPTHLRATKVTSCAPYAPQPLSNSKEPNNAAPRVVTRLKQQLMNSTVQLNSELRKL